MTARLVLVRHGQSTWNLENLFTGWTDVDLTAQGREEARSAGQLLREHGLGFDIAFTSVLKRAIRTLWILIDEMDHMWMPVENDWRLNERHYGALQGLNKAETTAKYGAEQVKIWRRSYDVPPSPLAADDPRHPKFDPRYRDIPPVLLPATESLKDTLARVLPCWRERIQPALAADRDVLVQAAGRAGLDTAGARDVLESGRYAAEVRERERFYLDRGIHAVPAVIVNDRHLVQGGQPPEVFEQALRRIAAGLA